MTNADSSLALSGRRRWGLIGSLLIAAVAVCALPAVAAAKKPPQKPKVASFNLYLGTDLPNIDNVFNNPAFGTSAVDRGANAIGFGLNDVNANDFNVRAKTIASLITKKKIDLVGLQESALWKVQLPSDLSPVNPASIRAGLVTYDYTEALLAELNKKAKTGAECKQKDIPKAKCYKGYRLVVSQQEADIEFFADFDNNCGTVKPGCGLGPAFTPPGGPGSGPPSHGGAAETNPGSDDTGIFAIEPAAAALGLTSAGDWNGDEDVNCDGAPDAGSTTFPHGADAGLNVTNNPPPPSPLSCSAPSGPAAAPTDCPDSNAAGGFLTPTSPLGPNTTDGTSSCFVHGVDGDVSLTMRDAILARKGTKTKNTTSANYSAPNQFATSLLGGAVTISFNRGWTSTDATVRGKKFRFVNTHLESEDTGTIRESQAGELIAPGGPATAKKTVLVGDLNSDPASADPESPPAYNTLAAAGFRSLTGPAPTSGHLDTGRTYADASETGAILSNPNDLATNSRIDHILTNSPKVKKKGGGLLDKFASGLWSSDHAGVWAGLKIK